MGRGNWDHRLGLPLRGPPKSSRSHHELGHSAWDEGGGQVRAPLQTNGELVVSKQNDFANFPWCTEVVVRRIHFIEREGGREGHLKDTALP